MKFLSKNSKTTKAFNLSVSFFHRVGRDARLDWVLSVSCALLVTLFFVFVAFMAYSGKSLQNISVKPQTVVPKPLFDTAILDSVVKTYSDRAIVHEQFISGYHGVGDPSI